MSALESRLSALRMQRGEGGAAPGSRNAASSFRDRVARLRAGGDRPQARPDDRALAAKVGGEPIAPGLIVVERAIAPGARHGRATIRREGVGTTIAGLGAAGRAADDGVVFMDTETTGLAGGTGTVAFVIGIARFDGPTLRLSQWLLASFAGEPAMLTAVAARIADATALVTFNGRSFDAPLLAARYRLGGIEDPFARLDHADLLHPLRRAYARRWPDCRLASAEQRLLGFTRDDDLPGSEAPAAWLSWLRRGDTGDLARVLEHNRADLVSLAALVPVLGRCLDDPVAWDADALARRDGALEYLSVRRDRLDARELLTLAAHARRAGRWPLAVEIWERLARDDHPEAIERLAKYWEHQMCDPERALELARALLRLEPASVGHRHRERRLRRRLESN